jgi:hypothetical protein
VEARLYLTTIAQWSGGSGYPNWWDAGSAYWPINAISCDNAGNIYYTTNFGSFVIDSASGKVRQLLELADASGVCYVPGGKVLLGSNTGGRLLQYDLATGALSTIAGTGEFGYSGDNGAATAAKLGRVNSICLANDSAILFADSYFNCIRRIKNGIISTLNTGTLNGPAAIAFNRSGTSLYILENAGKRLLRYQIASGNVSVVCTGSGLTAFYEGCPAFNAFIYQGRGLAVDADGSIFFSDGTNCVRRIDSATNRMFTVAGKMGKSGWAGEGGTPDTSLFNKTGAIGFLHDSRALLISDELNARLRLLTESSIAAPSLSRYQYYCRWDKQPKALVEGGDTLRWYSTPRGGEPLTSMPSPDVRKVGLSTFFAATVKDGKESPRAAIQALVKTLNKWALPDSPTFFCQGEYLYELFYGCMNDWTYKYGSSSPYDATSFPDLSYDRDFSTEIDFSGKIQYAQNKVFWRSTDTSGCSVVLDSIIIPIPPPLPKPDCDSYIRVCNGDVPYQLKAQGKGIVWYGYPNGAPTTPIFPPGRTFEYILWQTDDYGCAGEWAKIKLYVAPVPIGPTVPNRNYAFCLNDSATTLLAYGDSVLWFDSVGAYLATNSFKPSTSKPGNFQFIARQVNADGCLSPQKEPVQVVIDPGPPIVAGYNSNGALVGSPVKLGAHSSGKLLWAAGESADTFAFVPQRAGTYTHRIIGVSERGCRDTVYQSINIGTEDYWNARIKVYPNPFVGEFTISGIDPAYLVNFRLVDQQGKTIYVQEPPVKELSFKIPSSVPPGNYLLELNTVGTANPSIHIRKDQ